MRALATYPGWAALLAVLVAGCASGGGAAGGPRKQAITPPGATRLAAYSSAVRSGGLIFFSGVIGTRPGSRELVEGGIREETRQTLANLSTNMAAAGVGAADLLKCTVFLADIRDYAAMNEVYGEFFRDIEPPARSAVGVAGLPAGARVEIECMAAARG
jgi:reactive intermediate/imine deaminase